MMKNIHLGQRARVLSAALVLLSGCGVGSRSTVAPHGDQQDSFRGEVSVDATPAPDATPADTAAPDSVPPETLDDETAPGDLVPDAPPDMAPDVGEPTVGFDAPEDNALVRGLVEIKVAAGDDDGVAMVRFLVDGGLLVEDGQVPWKADWDTAEFDDGAHVLEAVAFDTGGNSASAKIEVTVDNTPPELELLSPEEGAILHDAILLSAEATDAQQMDRVEFAVDDGEPDAITEEPWELEYDGSELTAGTHTVTATAVDAAGNETTVEGEFLVDRPPVVAVLSPAPDALVPGPVTVQAEAADDVDLQGVSLAVDGVWYGDLAVSRGTWEIPWTPAYEKAQRVLTLTATDSVGQETAASVTVLVDHPVTVALQLCEEAICEDLESDTELTGTVQLRAVAQDDGADIAAVDFLVDGEPALDDQEAPFDFPWSTTSVEDGARTIEVVAVNTQEETGSAQVIVLVNNCDLDHDGFVAAGCGGTDCDDGSEAFNPDAPDLVGDDTDQNCDGMDGVDADGDGYASKASGGDDCLDDDPAAHPCGDDLPGDGVDGNCDGADALSCDDCVLCTVDGLVGDQCVHAPVEDGGPCDDGDLCTDGDSCQDLLCLPGEPTDCDDGKPCTADGCAPDVGCYNLPLDGAPCPGGGTCLGDTCCVPACADKACGPDGCGGDCGACLADETCDPDGLCVAICGPPFAKVAMKLTSLLLSDNGHPGKALDVDDDPATCAPPGECSGGMNNAWGAIQWMLDWVLQANGKLNQDLQDGGLTLLADFDGFNLDGAPFVVRLMDGEAVLSQPECNWQAEVCPYLVDEGSFDPDDCTPLAWFDNAVVVDGTLHAGGEGYTLRWDVPIIDSALSVPVWSHHAMLTGDLVIEDEQVVGLEDAILGGAISRQALIESLESLPQDELPTISMMGFDVTLAGGLEMFLTNDIDVDGDGTKESFSFAVLHDAIRADLVGVVGVTDPDPCVPDCDGKECGDDGCGGSCGGCDEDSLCVDGGCVAGTPHTFKHDQFASDIQEAVEEIDAQALGAQPSFVQGDAFGVVFQPTSNMYPIKILGVDLAVAAMKNDPENSTTHANIEVYFLLDDEIDMDAIAPTFSVSTADVLNETTGEPGAPLVGDAPNSIDFDWQDPDGHPPMLNSGSFMIAVRFAQPAQDLQSEWGAFQCSQQPTIGLCGCQTVGTVHDQALTPSSNVLHVIYPPVSCQGAERTWVWFDDVGLTGDLIVRARALLGDAP